MLTAAGCHDVSFFLVIACAIFFGGALCAYALVVVALRWRRIRERAADPYARPHGDMPPVEHMRSFMGAQQ